MNFTKRVAVAAATTVALSAGAAMADATITVCTGAGGTNCATDTVTLKTGGHINQCVDGGRVRQSISGAGGQRSVNDALAGMYNLALRTAEAVEARGVEVTGFQAELEGCTGSWAPYCTTVTVGEVNAEGVSQSSPNYIIEALTGQESRGSAFNCPGRYPTVGLPGQLLV